MPVAAVALLLVGSACARPATAGPRPSPPGCPEAHLQPPPAAKALSGPAADLLTGGAARSGFSLDGGTLTVAPPDTGQRPAVSAEAATCAALASNDPDNSAFGDDARFAGMAYGYARVTVRDDLLGSASPAPIPPSRAYHSRLAWVVVVEHPVVFHCPMIAASRPDHRPPPPSYHGYEVFLLDATTGGDALAYTEGGVGCGGDTTYGPYLSVPTDGVSVPWRLVSRAGDGYTATLAAKMLPCDRADPPILPDEYTADLVRVVVQRPIGPPCGTATERLLTLHAATVAGDLPAALRHAPTGLLVPGSATDQPPPTAR